MDFSESCKPSFVPQSYERRAKIEFLSGTQFDSNTAKIESSMDWKAHLLPLSCIAAEDNLAVLRRELEAAHQLLKSQENTIHTLTVTLKNCDLQLQHTQNDLETAQQVCDRNSTQLTESESICRDLKTQLRRQQQRVLQYRNLLNERTGSISSLPASAQSFQETTVLFGYESITATVEAKPSRSSHPQRPAVAAWSAPESIDLTGPLACYQKLATIRMTTSMVRVESMSMSKGNLKAASVDHNPKTHAVKSNYLDPIDVNSTQHFRIELPSFTQSSPT